MKGFRALLLVLCLSLVTSLLGGCGGGSTTAEATSGDSSDKAVTITYAVWNKDQEPVMQNIAREFEKENPNIKVNVELTPYKQYFVKLETTASGGTMPDVFWMNGPRLAKYANAGILEPLNDYIAKDGVNLENYPKGLIELYTLNDNLYGLPKDFDTTALWYNKKLFDEANVAYPTNDWTWDDMVAAAEKLTNKEKGIYGISFTNDNQVGVYNTIAQAGGYVVSPDRTKSGYDLPETKAGIQVWVDLINSGVSPGLQDITEVSVDAMFQSEKVAMIFDASWQVKPYMENEIIKDHIDLVVMPVIKQRSAVIHGLGNAISASSPNKEAAWKFVKFLGDKKANDMQAESGVVIPAYKESLPLWLNAYPNVNLKAFTDELEYSYMYPSTIDTSKWNDVEGEYLKLVWAGEMTVEEACNKIAEEMNKILADEKK